MYGIVLPTAFSKGAIQSFCNAAVAFAVASSIVVFRPAFVIVTLSVVMTLSNFVNTAMIGTRDDNIRKNAECV